MRTVLVLALLQWPLGAETPAPAPAPTPEPESRDAGPAAIALPEVLRSAEKAHRALKSMAKPLADDQLIEEVQQGLPSAGVEHRSTGRNRARYPRSRTWPMSARRCSGRTILSPRGTRGSSRPCAPSTRTVKSSNAWTRSGRSPRPRPGKDGAPTPVLERIAALRASIAATAAQARTQLGQLLTTQNQVTTVRMRIGDALAGVAKAEALQAEQLFEVESVPFWKLLSRPTQVEKVRQQIIQTLRTHATALKDFVRSHSEPVLVLARPPGGRHLRSLAGTGAARSGDGQRPRHRDRGRRASAPHRRGLAPDPHRRHGLAPATPGGRLPGPPPRDAGGLLRRRDRASSRRGPGARPTPWGSSSPSTSSPPSRPTCRCCGGSSCSPSASRRRRCCWTIFAGAAGRRTLRRSAGGRSSGPR